MPIGLGFLESLAAEFAALLMNKGFSTTPEKKLKKALRGIIDQTCVDFGNKYPVKYQRDQIPFYGSETIMRCLLNFSFFEEIDPQKIFAELEKNPAIIKPTDEEIKEFLKIFRTKLDEKPELIRLEKLTTFVDRNFLNFQKLDEALRLLRLLLEGRQPAPLPRATTLPGYNPADLIGREAKLKELHGALGGHDTVMLVNGLGGIGKTALAQAYVNIPEYSQHYKHLAWATVTRSIADDVTAALLGKVPGFDYDKSLDALGNFCVLLGRLGAMGNDNLLVIDNANDIDDLVSVQQALRNFTWKTLVTSRTEPMDFKVITLDELEPDDALKLFYKHYKSSKNDDLVNNILKKIEYHTLLIELFAKAANENPALKLEGLLDMIEKTDWKNPALEAEITTPHFLSPDKKQKMIKAYAYISELYKTSGLGDDEKRIMRYFSVLPSEPYAFYDVAAMFGETGKAGALGMSLQKLRRKGWLIENGGKWRCHQVVQEVVRAQLKPGMDNCRPLVNAFAGLLNVDQATENPVTKFKWAGPAQVVAQRLDCGDEDLAVLQSNLGALLREMGILHIARSLMEKALASDIKNFGEDHPTVAISRSNLATVLKNLGELPEARSLMEKALASDIKNFGEDHPTVAISRSNLATVLKNLGELPEARSLMEKALASDIKNFGEDHPTVAISRSNLATVLKNLGELPEARSLMEKALASDIKNFGENHTTVATDYNNLAHLLYQMGEKPQAVEYMEKAVKIRIKALGENHPYTLGSIKALESWKKELE